MSNTLFVSKVSDSDLILRYDLLSETFGKVESNSIGHSPWSNDYPYIPNVSFKIIHSESFIGLHYIVNEEYLRANAIRANESVWEDSCVEFFLSLDNKKTYYNFEFNVLGTGLIGYGSATKSERNRLLETQIDSVNVLTQVIKKDATKTWEIFLVIPKNIISDDEMSGKTYHANFYKCGDNLPRPHFLTWNFIENASPNFHLPQYFGELNFK